MDVFQAVADPNRRAMLDLLIAGERSVQEIVSHFDMTFQGVSQHLGVLADAGLVTRRKAGRRRLYRLKPGAFRDMRAWVDKYEAFWNERLDRLGEALDEEA